MLRRHAESRVVRFTNRHPVLTCVLLVALTACDAASEAPLPDSANASEDSGALERDASALSVMDASAPIADASSRIADAGSRIADAGSRIADASSTIADARSPVDSGSTSDAGRRVADIDLTFDGACSPEFAGMLHVTTSTGVVHITSVLEGRTANTFQLGLEGVPEVVHLNSRIRNGDYFIINLFDGDTTYNNVAHDPRFWGGTIPDPIRGTLTIHAFNAGTGVVDLEFDQVVLQRSHPSVADCEITGRLRTYGRTI